MSVSLIRRYARNAAVRVGTRNHAGFHTGIGATVDGGPAYARQCAGYQSVNASSVGAANNDRIDCGNCARFHVATVAAIHAAQDAAALAAALVVAGEAFAAIGRGELRPVPDVTGPMIARVGLVDATAADGAWSLV